MPVFYWKFLIWASREPSAPATSTCCSEGTNESYSAYPWTIFDDINFHVEYEAELRFTPNPKEEGFSGIGNRGFAGNPNGNIVKNSNRAPENPSGGDVGNGVGENPSEQIAKKPNMVAEHPIGEMVEGFRGNPCAVTGNSIGDPWTIFDDINFHVEYEAELRFTPNPKEEGFSGIGNRGA